MRKPLLPILSAWSIWFCSMAIVCGVWTDDKDLPQQSQVESFLKSKLPEHFKYRGIQDKSSQLSETGVVVYATLAGVPIKHLYVDATTNAIPELTTASVSSAGLERPVILKKNHSIGESLKIPFEAYFKKVNDHWEPALFEDYKQLEALGRPLDDYKFGALIFGSSEAKKAIEQFRKELKKHAPPESRSDLEVYLEIEKAFYIYPKSNEQRLQKVEDSVLKLLGTPDHSDTEIQEFAQRYGREMVVLSQNYRKAASMQDLKDSTAALNLKIMCQSFADAYEAFGAGNWTEARLNMKRALEKQKEVRSAIARSQ